MTYYIIVRDHGEDGILPEFPHPVYAAEQSGDIPYLLQEYAYKIYRRDGVDGRMLVAGRKEVYLPCEMSDKDFVLMTLTAKLID